MIDYWKLGIIAGIVIAVFGGGWWVGHQSYVKYKAEVELIAKTQEAKVKSIEAQQKLVTKGIENEYNAKLALIRQYYSSGVRQPSPDTMSKYGISTKFPDANPAYIELAGNCAQTTLMLVELQKWINEQYAIK